ncbi:MAG: DUF2335 domain-containing protein [Nitrospirae bacterium]|nr:DUF2335 domain-containing protein [Nitrospirota bacterium]
MPKKKLTDNQNRLSLRNKNSNHQDKPPLPPKSLVSMEYRGPLPPASEFAKYEAAHPGTADRILAMAEEQGRHRREIEKRIVNIEGRNSLLGLIFAFLIALSIIAGSIFLIFNNKEISGLSLGVTGVASLVGVFIYGSRQKRLKREKMNKHISGNDTPEREQ